MSSFEAFILTHEDLAFSLKATTEKVTGPQRNIYPYSNKKDALPVIFEKIKVQLSKLNSDIIFIFVDLIGGSCWSLANMIFKEYPDVVIIGGVNLPMLISLIVNHDRMEKEELINKIKTDSIKGIQILGRN